MNITSINSRKFKDYTTLDLVVRADILRKCIAVMAVAGGRISSAAAGNTKLVPEYDGIIDPIKFQFEYLTSCLKEAELEIEFRKNK